VSGIDSDDTLEEFTDFLASIPEPTATMTFAEIKAAAKAGSGLALVKTFLADLEGRVECLDTRRGLIQVAGRILEISQLDVRRRIRRAALPAPFIVSLAEEWYEQRSEAARAIERAIPLSRRFARDAGGITSACRERLRACGDEIEKLRRQYDLTEAQAVAHLGVEPELLALMLPDYMPGVHLRRQARAWFARGAS
jgi:hypothetical protein